MNLESLTLADIEAAIRIQQRNKIQRYYPDTGPLRRELYVKHMAFFAAGATERQRCMLAANRVGKTEGVGAYETTCHLTGIYPKWWTGKRFTKPVKAWAAGDTSKTVREIIQFKLLGNPGQYGTGMIPGDLLVKTTPKTGVPDSVDTIYVKHASGKNSMLVLKSYDQRRESFQGTEQDFIWLDEEPGADIYSECFMRTADTSGGKRPAGMLFLTFTPLYGWTDVVEGFLNEEKRKKSGRWLIQATWDDAPHISPEEREILFHGLPPHEREARSKGVPSLGAGAIYPVPEDDVVVKPFEIPEHWPRAYGLDVGWNRTACIWGAHDRETGTIYLYSEHYRGEAEPSVHADAIRARGVWIPGVIDPASRGRSQRDGEQLIRDYIDLGLDLQPANNSRESGLYLVWQLLSAGKLKVFESLGNWRSEFRLYRRDMDGKIVKENDHLMDAMRYLIVSGRDRMKTKPADKPKPAPWQQGMGNQSLGWMR